MSLSTRFSEDKPDLRFAKKQEFSESCKQKSRLLQEISQIFRRLPNKYLLLRLLYIGKDIQRERNGKKKTT